MQILTIDQPKASTVSGCLSRSYRHLDDVLDRAYGGDVFAAEDALNSLHYTLASTASFQNVIERCLDLDSKGAVVG